MAWDANEKGNYAYLTKTASEHGGVANFISDIHDKGYQEGHKYGIIEGVFDAIILIGVCKGIKYLVQKYEAKKQAVVERAEAAQDALRQIFNNSDSGSYDESEKSEIDNE